MEQVLVEPTQPGLLEKAGRQMRRHPLIPTGMVATVGALTMALKRMQQRNAVGYQRWLRARVVAQGLTIVAIVVAGVQEMGTGVLTGNSRRTTPPPSSALESREFEKRLKEAEEAHDAETGVRSSDSRSGPDPAASSPIIQGTNAAASSPRTSASSWASWLGWSKK